ncbi:twin-arginine translocase TatA/TatE family subunit [Stakelama tenebrarum]|uniref:Sec-independent protein translocase protein TatA n=1 Tax=Stakelama tenebrarum TaxID=2711215 RepID=A0A6G6Y4U4_9SPHN|nr:twin-arginine translocase TatA/TatE family subunit [Sphingosinithalassobacter tenebrarum]QIG79827.1 Sec-independent protein translocase TatA [Sphingosinithalassobacter tenebrarum]
MSPSIWQIIIVALIAVVLLGGGRFSSMMGDVAKGIKSFKKGMSEDDNATPAPPSRIEGRRASEPGVETETERSREEQR